MDDDFDDVSANDNGLDDLDVDENGIYRDLNLEQLDFDGFEESSSLHSLGESDLLNINEDGIWQDDVENFYTNYSNQQDSISDVLANASSPFLDEAGTRVDGGGNNDGTNISELEVSQSTSHRDSISDVFNPSSEATASQLQLPELATGYCTSDSEVHHHHQQSADKRSKKKSSQFVEDEQPKSRERPNKHALSTTSVRPTGNRTPSKGDAQDDLGTEIHWMTSDDESSMTSRSRGDSDSDIKEFETLEKTLAESSPRTRLPVYVRRSASSCLQAGTSTDESPERVSARTTPGNLKRTCTVRQSKRYRDYSSDAPAAAAVESYQDTQRSNDSKIPVLRSRSSSRPHSRAQSLSRNLSQMSLRNDDDEPLRQEADVAPSMPQQGRRGTEAVADMTSTFPRDGFTSNNHQIDDTVARSTDRLRTANVHDRYRSSSAGIPSSEHLLTPSTAADADQLLPLDAARQRRSRRSCSLERSVLAAPVGRKHRRHTLVSSTPALDPTATGSSSMDDSEDGDGSGTSRHKLKARFLAEMKERKRQEETVKHLQQNYDDLLRSHAEKELAIEQLRLGARVTLLVDPPAPSHVETGSVAPARKPVLFNIPRAGTASIGPVGSIGVKQQAKLITMSDIHPASTDSLIDNNRQQQQPGTSSDGYFKTTSMAPHQPTSSANDNVIDVRNAITVTSSSELLPAAAAANNRRRSWLVSTADDIQKKMNEFEILLNHDMNLKLDEQLTVLSNLQSDCNNLRMAARQNSDGITTTLLQSGHSSLPTGQLSGLDVELEKLDQHLNKLSRRVQENVTSHTASNSALPLHGGGPMRADHSIRVDSVVDDVINGHVTGFNVRPPDGGYQQNSANSSRSSSRRSTGVTGAMKSTGNDVTDQPLSHVAGNLIHDEVEPMSPHLIDARLSSNMTSPSARQSQNTATIDRPVNNAVRRLSSRTLNNENTSCSESEAPSGGRRPDTHLSASETSAASELRQCWNPATVDNNNNKRQPTTSRQQPERTAARGNVTSDSNDSSRSSSRANRRLPSSVSQARHESSHRNKNSHRGQTSDVVTDVGRHGTRQKDTDSGYVGSTSTTSRRDNQPGSRSRTGDSRTRNEHKRSEPVQPRSRTESIRSKPSAVHTASDQLQFTSSSSSESSRSSSADTVEERRVSKPAAQRQLSTATAAVATQQQQPTLILQPIPVHQMPSQANTVGVNLNGATLPQTFNGAIGNLLRSDLVVNRTALPGVNLMGYNGPATAASGSVPLGGFNSTALYNVPASTIPASAIASSHATGPIPYAQLHTNGTVPAGYGLSSNGGLFPIQQLPAPDLSYRLGAGPSVPPPPAATGYHRSPASQYVDGRGGYDVMADFAGMSRDGRRQRSQSVGQQQRKGRRYRGNDSHGNGPYGQSGQPPVTIPPYAPGNPLMNDSQPLPSMYCEPSGAWFGGGPAPQDQNTHYTTRGIQNVPHTSSTGVQYSSLQSSGVGGSGGNQPVILTGLACPLCGASHYHAHADCTENGYPTLAAAAAANSVGSSGVIGQHSTLVNAAAAPAVVGNYAQQSVVGATSQYQLANAAVIGAAGPTGPSAMHSTTRGQNGQQYVANSHGYVSMAPQTYSTFVPIPTAAGQQQQQQQPQYVDVGHTQRARVRYYVREYGDIPSDGGRLVPRHVTPTPRRRRHHHTSGRSRSTNFRSDEQDSDADDDDVMLNASLSEAVATAKHLQSLSMRMKSSLRSELNAHPFRTLSLVDSY